MLTFLKRVTILPPLLLVAFGATPAHDPQPPATTPRTASSPVDLQGRGVLDPGEKLSDRTFFVRALGDRCLDFGGQAWWTAGAPVIIYQCNKSLAQQVRVKEIDISHDVELRVQALFCLGIRGGRVASGQPLELQACSGSPAQRFALDGDAILMGTQASGKVSREYVIEPERNYTAARTPLVVGTREVSDAEYFRFVAVDGTDARATRGFVSVATEGRLDWALTLGWGTVIEIDDREPLRLTRAAARNIPSGVTLRGYRKYNYQGPELRRDTLPIEPAFVLTNDDVRITGLRFRGPGPSSREVRTIWIQSEGDRPPRVLIDHVDASYWIGHVVDVWGPGASLTECAVRPPEYPRQAAVRAIGNFIHHNMHYGVVAGHGAFVLVQGNVLYAQGAHSISSDGQSMTGYLAHDNLVLSQTGTHDIDMHGSQAYDSQNDCHWCGGLSGDYFDVGWNTLLPTGHGNVKQRGTPCRFTAIHDNVFLQSKANAIATLSKDPAKHVVYANTYGASNPTSDLSVGDFDGDGIDDVFLGTGAAWYFSSGGQAEWRFLNRMPERASVLRFGDFDGDRRTDVLALHEGNIDVSWGGGSSWQTINVTAWKVEDLAVGDFDGDRRADLFLATGNDWFLASGGRNWAPLAHMPQRTSQLRFGDFTKDGKTDVFGVVDGQWKIVRGGAANWDQLRPGLTSFVTGLVVADFNGDGFADVARTSSGWWQLSLAGVGGWTNLRESSTTISAMSVGRFDGNATTDVIVWDGSHFNVAPSGRNPVIRLSRQIMK